MTADVDRLDPIMQGDELTWNEAEDMRECEGCGKLTFEFFTVSDCDPSVGYHSTIEVCEECAAHTENHCGGCR